MTTMNISDISHKKRVSSRYQPNSYRIFCEDLPNDSLPENYQYSNGAPEIYSHPPILPAQAIEDRNRPHGGRGATFLRENTRTLNDPVPVVAGIRVAPKEIDKRWWEWNTAAQDDDPNWKSKKRSNSTVNLAERIASGASNGGSNNGGSGGGFQTTYQKEHGYLTSDFYRKPGSLSGAQGGVNRHSNNPNTIQATGIVPVSEYKNYVPDTQERVLVDRTSFEHGYDSRDQNNYPARGKRHGAFVIEQLEPQPIRGTKQYPDMNKGTSVWDCMHPHDEALGNLPPKPITNKTFSATSNKSETRNQRRDPIGYFEDRKYIEANDSNIPNGGGMNTNNKYTPSWSNGYNDVNNNSIPLQPNYPPAAYQQNYPPVDLGQNNYMNQYQPEVAN